eukprot:9270131-Prorocentrum_lima.AAC.1
MHGATVEDSMSRLNILHSCGIVARVEERIIIKVGVLLLEAFCVPLNLYPNILSHTGGGLPHS